MAGLRGITESETRLRGLLAPLKHHTFTATFVVDVLKLIEITGRNRVRLVPIESIKPGWKNLRQSYSGFRKARLETADLSQPLLVTSRFELIDGRHRLILLRRNKATKASIRVVTGAQLGRCIVRIE